MPQPICLILLFAAAALCRSAAATGGRWDLLQQNIGIVAMHMQLLHDNRVIILDRTDFGRSNISLPDHKCRVDPNEMRLKVDCTAHSVEYDVVSNSIRPLMVLTNVWCSSGAVMPDGKLVHAGGFNDGDHVVRFYTPCSDGGTCDWQEIKYGLTQRRWYATSHILPDGRQIIVGGRRQFNYEFFPKLTSPTSYVLPFLVQTYDHPDLENNLYPFVFLNVDGGLFVFANNRAILLDYTNNVVVKTYPEIPGGDPRNYPSSGSAVLLPLKNLQAETLEAEVMVCGGAPKGAYVKANTSRIFEPALDTCGRIKITDSDPQWVMEQMPMGRVMGDMVLLPDGNVLIINGAGSGTAGFNDARDPVFNPVIYRPDYTAGSRFEIQNASTIPRMYHSTAILLADGRVLVGGSNPNVDYEFTGVVFSTELRLESFSPWYLDSEFEYTRPTILLPITQTRIGYGQNVSVRFSVPGRVNLTSVMVTMVAPAFSTHSFSMSQRLLVLGSGNVTLVGLKKYGIRVVTPGSGNIAPAGFYMLFVVHQGIPSEAVWIQLQ